MRKRVRTILNYVAIGGWVLATPLIYDGSGMSHGNAMIVDAALGVAIFVVLLFVNVWLED